MEGIKGHLDSLYIIGQEINEALDDGDVGRIFDAGQRIKDIVLLLGEALDVEIVDLDAEDGEG